MIGEVRLALPHVLYPRRSCEHSTKGEEPLLDGLEDPARSIILRVDPMRVLRHATSPKALAFRGSVARIAALQVVNRSIGDGRWPALRFVMLCRDGSPAAQ
jgi:hypothetical protein